MLVVLIFALFIFMGYLTFNSFYKSRIQYFGLASGVLIGGVYFLIVPFFFILIYGELFDPGLKISPYKPFEDIWTTINIFIGWGVILISQNIEKRTMQRQVDRSKAIVKPLQPKITVAALAMLYVIISLYAGYSSGVFTNGLHWHDSSRFNSTSFLILKNFSNCYRVVFFGGLLYLHEKGYLRLNKVIFFALMMTFFDFFISFNRITAVYFIILLALLYRRQFIWFFVVGVCVSPLVSHISSVWTWFRGVASLNGYTVTGFINAWIDVSRSYDALSDSFVVKMNAIFESSNILVFHYLVENVGKSIPVLMGETFILRPLTTFIPSTLWPDKPGVFGVFLGEQIQGVSGLALNSTLFGEAYGNFLYLWPLILLLTITAFSRVFIYFDKTMPGLTFMSIFIGVSLWRFEMNFSVASIYSLIIIGLLVHVYSMKRYMVKIR